MKNKTNADVVRRLKKLKDHMSKSFLLRADEQQIAVEVLQTYIDSSEYSEFEISFESVMIEIFRNLQDAKKDGK